MQDCGVLVNFDLHWNPVRMIQRNGRINRLGSEHEQVFIYNMHPETNLETYLRLVQRLEQKIDRIKYTIGTDQSVLGEEARPIEYLDQIEAQNQPVSLADIYDPDKAEEAYKQAMGDNEQFLSADEYISDLRIFLEEADEETQARVRNIPVGKWGYMPAKALDVDRPAVMSLTCTQGVILETGNQFVNHVFVKIIPGDGLLVEIMETMEALRYLRTDSSDNKPQIDRIDYDRPEVRDYALLISEQDAIKKNGDFKPTKLQKQVLSKLYDMAPELQIADKLKLIATKQDAAMIKDLFTVAAAELKQRGEFSSNILKGFEDAINRLDAYDKHSKQVTQAKGVLFYARQ